VVRPPFLCSVGHGESPRIFGGKMRIVPDSFFDPSSGKSQHDQKLTIDRPTRSSQQPMAPLRSTRKTSLSRCAGRTP